MLESAEFHFVELCFPSPRRRAARRGEKILNNSADKCIFPWGFVLFFSFFFPLSPSFPLFPSLFFFFFFLSSFFDKNQKYILNIFNINVPALKPNTRCHAWKESKLNIIFKQQELKCDRSWIVSCIYLVPEFDCSCNTLTWINPKFILNNKC